MGEGQLSPLIKIIMKYIFRILILPFLAFIVLIRNLYLTGKVLAMYLRWGGEYIIYDRDAKHIADVYNKLNEGIWTIKENDQTK